MNLKTLKQQSVLALGLAILIGPAMAQKKIPTGIVDLDTSSSTGAGADHPGRAIYRMTCYPCHRLGDPAPDLADPSLRERLLPQGAQALAAGFMTGNIFHENLTPTYSWTPEKLQAAFAFLLSAEQDQLVEMDRFDVVENPVDEEEYARMMAEAQRQVPIDLREIEHLPGAEFVDEPDFKSVHYKAPGGLPRAVEFYRSRLLADDWQEVKKDHSKMMNILESLGFMKDGYYILFQISVNPDDLDTANVYIYNTGNVDMRGLPAPDDAEPGDEYRFNTLRYSTKRSLEEMIAFYRDELTDLGWTETGESDDDATPHSHSLYFEKDFVNVNLSFSWNQEQKLTQVSLGAYQGP